MGYDYERFTPDRFQEFCSALIASQYPDAQSLPVGQKDGGRDGTAGSASKGDLKIFQVKFRRRLLARENHLKWLISSVKDELPKIERLVTRGATSYLLITNVPGTAALDSGTIDKMQAYLDQVLPIPGRVWWRDDLDARLDNSYDLKWAYSEIITSQDMIRMIFEASDKSERGRRRAALEGYLRKQYADDEFVKFKQAELQSSELLELFIDVPGEPVGPVDATTAKTWNSVMLANASSDTVRGVEYAGGTIYSHARNQIGAATLLLDPRGQRAFDRMVIEGAPGQGKSTLAQYLCQVHRMRLLARDEINQLPGEHRLSPVRAPFKVDLRDLARWLANENPFPGVEVDAKVRSLESFLAQQVVFSSGGQSFTVDDLTNIFQDVPALIVLDGLDEVASLAQRAQVIEAIDTAATRMQTTGKSIQFIVTSRPAAIPNAPQFAVKRWKKLSLTSIDEPLIFDYMGRWAKARRVPPQDRDDIRATLQEKLASPHIKDLARNPMQLTILLSLIYSRGRSLPDQRTQLYDNYIDVFFNREAEKDATVRDNRQLLIDLHGYIAWNIHASAEARRTAGRLAGWRASRPNFPILTKERL
ncbi:NACHT domain-containing protein [Kribbella sp. GL6]|uniref:NACHT domain-containing protein n=1 Tax=Kribbella sp. GL6 TaxID=3419765 RepID=UPI003D014143